MLGRVVLGDVLLDQLAADPDLVERTVAVCNVRGAPDLRAVAMLVLAVHVQHQHFEPAVGQHLADACEPTAAGLQAYDVFDGESLGCRGALRATGRGRSRLSSTRRS